MGLFGGSKSSSSSSTTNYSYTTSQSLGDLASSNVQSAGDVTIYGLYGDDAQAFLQNVSDMATKATTSNSNLAGAAIAEVAKGYQSAYSESTGIIQQLKPVLLAGVAVLALAYGTKFIKG